MKGATRKWVTPDDDSGGYVLPNNTLSPDDRKWIEEVATKQLKAIVEEFRDNEVTITIKLEKKS
jgi:hypothetical protein